MTVAQDQASLALARAQMDAILGTGAVVTADGRTLTFVDLPKIQEVIEWLEARIGAASTTRNGGRNQLIEVVPRV